MEPTTWSSLAPAEFNDPAIIAAQLAGSARGVIPLSPWQFVSLQAERHVAALLQIASGQISQDPHVLHPDEMAADLYAFVKSQPLHERLSILAQYCENVQEAGLPAIVSQEYLVGIAKRINWCLEDHCDLLLNQDDRMSPHESMLSLLSLLTSLERLSLFQLQATDQRLGCGSAGSLATELLRITGSLHGDFERQLYVLCKRLQQSEDLKLRELSASAASAAARVCQRIRPCRAMLFIQLERSIQVIDDEQLFNFEMAVRATNDALTHTQPRPDPPPALPEVPWQRLMESKANKSPSFAPAIRALERQLGKICDAAAGVTASSTYPTATRKQALRLGLDYVQARHNLILPLAGHLLDEKRPAFSQLLSHWSNLILWRVLSRQPALPSPPLEPAVLQEETSAVLLVLIEVAQAEELEELCIRLLDQGEWCQLEHLAARVSLLRRLQEKTGPERKEEIEVLLSLSAKKSAAASEAYVKLLLESNLFSSCVNLYANAAAWQPVKSASGVREKALLLISEGIESNSREERDAAIHLFLQEFSEGAPSELLDAFCLVYRQSSHHHLPLMQWMRLLHQRIDSSPPLDYQSWARQLIQAMLLSKTEYVEQAGHAKAIACLTNELRILNPILAWDLFVHAKRLIPSLELAPHDKLSLAQAAIAADMSDKDALARVKQLLDERDSLGEVLLDYAGLISALGVLQRASSRLTERLKLVNRLWEASELQARDHGREQVLKLLGSWASEFPVSPASVAPDLVKCLPAELQVEVVQAILAVHRKSFASSDVIAATLQMVRQFGCEEAATSWLLKNAKSVPEVYLEGLQKSGAFMNCRAVVDNETWITPVIHWAETQEVYERTIVRGFGSADLDICSQARQLALTYGKRFPTRFFKEGFLAALVAQFSKLPPSKSESGTLISLIAVEAKGTRKEMVPLLCSLAQLALQAMAEPPTDTESLALLALAKRLPEQTSAVAIRKRLEAPLTSTPRKQRRRGKGKGRIKGREQSTGAPPILESKASDPAVGLARDEVLRRLFPIPESQRASMASSGTSRSATGTHAEGVVQGSKKTTSEQLRRAQTSIIHFPSRDEGETPTATATNSEVSQAKSAPARTNKSRRSRGRAREPERQFTNAILEGQWEIAKELYSPRLQHKHWVPSLLFKPEASDSREVQLKKAREFFVRLNQLIGLFSGTDEQAQLASLLADVLPYLSWDNERLADPSLGSERAAALTSIMELLVQAPREMEALLNARFRIHMFLHQESSPNSGMMVIDQFPAEARRRYVIAAARGFIFENSLAGYDFAHMCLLESIEEQSVSAPEAIDWLTRVYEGLLTDLVDHGTASKLEEAAELLSEWEEPESGLLTVSHDGLDEGRRRRLFALIAILRCYVYSSIASDEEINEAVACGLKKVLSIGGCKDLAHTRDLAVDRAVRSLTAYAAETGNYSKETFDLLQQVIQTGAGGDLVERWLRDELIPDVRAPNNAVLIALAKTLLVSLPKSRHDDSDLLRCHIAVLQGIRYLHSKRSDEYVTWFHDLCAQLDLLGPTQDADKVYIEWMNYLAKEAGKSDLHAPVSAVLEQTLVGRQVTSYPEFEHRTICNVYSSVRQRLSNTTNPLVYDASLGRILGRLTLLGDQRTSADQYVTDSEHLKIMEQIVEGSRRLEGGQPVDNELPGAAVFGIVERLLSSQWSLLNRLIQGKEGLLSPGQCKDTEVDLLLRSGCLKALEGQGIMRCIHNSLMAINGMIHCRQVEGDEQFPHVLAAYERYKKVSKATNQTIDREGNHIRRFHTLLVTSLAHLSDDKLASSKASVCWLMRNALSKNLYKDDRTNFFNLFRLLFAKSLTAGPKSAAALLPALWEDIEVAFPEEPLRKMILETDAAKILEYQSRQPDSPAFQRLAQLLKDYKINVGTSRRATASRSRRPRGQSVGGFDLERQ